MNISVLLSAGIGSRMNTNKPKQYLDLCGKEILYYSIDALKKSLKTDKIMVMVTDDLENKKRIEDEYGVFCLVGGSSRNESLKIALDYIKANYECDKVFVHEAARPFINENIIDEYFQKLEEYDAVITTKHITDSLGQYNNEYVNRDEYCLIQAPEAFKFNQLYENFKADSDITATVQQLPNDISIYRNFDIKNNLKITYSEDLEMAKILMQGAKNNE